MSTAEDLEKKTDEEESSSEEGSALEAEESSASEAEERAESARPSGRAPRLALREGSEESSEALAPTQLGTQRFVSAAYFGGAIGIAFFASKLIDFAWQRIELWKPVIGEPQEEVVMLFSALLGAGTAYYYWKRTRARQLAEEVASELSKVTWPGKQEVTNSTAVVIVTTIFATVFFALMDRFWGFVTNLVYGT